jgi:deferrochelatase/peroxidase EfeB
MGAEAGAPLAASEVEACEAAADAGADGAAEGALILPSSITGRYEFLSFRQPAQGRAWLRGILDKVASVQQARESIEREQRWVAVAFTWQGLGVLGVDDQSLGTFPEEFRQGMPARAEVLFDTGRNRPDKWVGGLASPDLHAIAILFARNAAERERVTREHRAFLASQPSVQVLSSLDLDGIPPFDYAHEHFGYRDRLSEPQIEGSGIQPTPGSGAPVKAGEFILGQEDESGEVVPLPKPEVLTRNGTFMAYRRLQEHVGAFREFLSQHGGPTAEGQELIAAKLMGRWRSGAPLVLAPERDDPGLGADYQRNNNFTWKNGPARLCHSSWSTYSAYESPRYCVVHAAAKNDSSWCDVWTAFARRRAGRWRRSWNCGIHSLCKPRAAI